MVCGLLAAHGVFFGDCRKPHRGNPRGVFENLWLKHAVRTGHLGHWPESWYARLRTEGWDGAAPWGAKLLWVRWPLMVKTDLAAVVICRRPAKDVLASRIRMGWKGSVEAIVHAYAVMDTFRDHVFDCPVIDVQTDLVVKTGELEQLHPAFEALGMQMSTRVASEWIDRGLWHS
jgi:hypothetical protein